MPKTLYVYDEKTGKISYTIENANAQNAKNLQDRGVSFFADSTAHSLIGTYVVQNTATGKIDGVKPMTTMDFIRVNKSEVVANGTDVALISNIALKTTVSVPKNEFSFVSNATFNYFEISANGYSLDPAENVIQVHLSKYGYRDVSMVFTLLPDVE